MARKKIIHLIMDYSAGDLACSEVVSAVSAHIPGDYNLHLTSVGSFDTISTGFCTAQLGNCSTEIRPKDTVIYSNCAPRRDLKNARLNNEGEGLLFGVLKSGVKIFVVNSGYSLSFVKSDLEELYSVNVSSAGSQFRSRDNFPKVIGEYLHDSISNSVIGNALNPELVIPDMPKSCIGYIDSFGNLKTTIRDGDDIVNKIKSGQRLSITINDVTMLATASTGSFNVDEGDIAFSPGSSGEKLKYWEIFQRGASAWRTYKKPKTGSVITINF